MGASLYSLFAICSDLGFLVNIGDLRLPARINGSLVETGRHSRDRECGEDCAILRYHRGHRAPSMTTNLQPTIHDVVAQLNILTNKLKDSANEDDRRALLKQFRILLNEADKIIERRLRPE